MSCKSCGSNASFWCSKCMKVKYCGSSCQEKHYTKHINGCIPFYFFIGGKRKEGQTKEEQDKAESGFIRLYAAYKRENDNPVYIPQLEELFGEMSDEKQREYIDRLPCHEDVDVLSQESVSSLEPDNRIYIMANNIKWCFSLDHLVGYIKAMQTRDPVYGVRDAKNPVTRQPFSQDDLRRIQEASELRLLTLWTKVRESNDVNVVKETIEILSDFYKIPSYTMDDAKQTRLKREMEAVYQRDIPYLVSKWPLLKVLGAQLTMLEWMRFKGKSLSYLDQLFETKEDVEQEFLKSGDLYSLLQDSESNLVVRTVIRNLWNRLEGPEDATVSVEKLRDLVTSKIIYEMMVMINTDNYFLKVMRNRGELLKDAYNRVFQDFCQNNIGPYARWNRNEAHWLGYPLNAKSSGLVVPWPGEPLQTPSTLGLPYSKIRLVVTVTEHQPKLKISFSSDDDVLAQKIPFPDGNAAARRFTIEQWVDLPTQELVNGLRQFAFTNIPEEIQPFLGVDIYTYRYKIGQDVDSMWVEPIEDVYLYKKLGDDYVDDAWSQIVSVVKKRWKTLQYFEVEFRISPEDSFVKEQMISQGITYAANHVDMWRKYIDLRTSGFLYSLEFIPFSDDQGAEWAKMFSNVQEFKKALEYLPPIFGSPPFDYTSKPNFWNAMFKKTFEQQFELAK